MRRIVCMAFALFFLWTLPCGAENYVLVGQMGSEIRYELEQRVTRSPGTQKLVLSFVVPPTFESPTYRQEIHGFDLVFSPQPKDKKRSQDKRGNQIIIATWKPTPPEITARISFKAQNQTRLQQLQTGTSFPLDNVPSDVSPYLSPTKQVQSDDPRIRKLAKELTQDVTTQFDAVQRILTWIVDNLRYVTPPAKYDALYGLEARKGNCQNFSHLSAALMRAVGIPVRIVNGVTLNQPFNVSRKGGVLTFKMGQGRHSWIEVWFEDLGWVPFDAQQTELFVSNRYVRVEVGIDNKETINDGLLRWSQVSGTNGKPSRQETISADFARYMVKIAGTPQQYGPKNLLLVPPVEAAFKEIVVAPPPPPPVIPKKDRDKLRFLVPFHYGNLEFPEDVDFAFPRGPASTVGDNRYQMTRNFLVETAEYVTTKLTQYAQVFELRKPVKLEKIGLALHRFGGDGQLWVELFEDKNMKPGALIATSDFISLSQLSMKPGYRWVDFDFGRDKPVLMPGSYWIALGFTGSPIVNWFYTYGKPVGPVEGTRYKGVYQDDWSNALSYEFNYRVLGLTVK
ncbi:MAG: transglutaminase domain-containing protein [Deltaproteobacteria bacterium]